MARPKEFDRDEALERALDVFWERGYEGTSIQDLVEATGVQRQSLYDTFGDKRALYLSALHRYAERTDEWIRSIEHPERSPLRMLRETLSAVTEDCARESRGCMLVNAGLDAGAEDAEVNECVQHNLERIEKAFATLVRHAQSAGEISRELKPKSAARTLVALMWGLRSMAKVRRDPAWFKSAIEQSIELLAHSH